MNLVHCRPYLLKIDLKDSWQGLGQPHEDTLHGDVTRFSLPESLVSQVYKNCFNSLKVGTVPGEDLP